MVKPFSRVGSSYGFMMDVFRDRITENVIQNETALFLPATLGGDAVFVNALLLS